MKTRVLITGSQGMLGKDIVRAFIKDPQYDVCGLDHHKSSSSLMYQLIYEDLTQLTEVNSLLMDIKPDIIIHCAARVNVNKCELEKDSTKLLHIESSRVLASYKPSKTRFIYISTDSVFDGIKGNYTEDDSANPLNYYAKTKHAGENVVMTINDNALIIRTNIYGFHNPVGTSLVEWAISSLLENKPITGFSDVFFNPLYTRQLAEIVASLTATETKGIINAGCDRFISKYEFLKELARTFKYDEMLIRKISVETIKFTAPRPRNTTLNIQKLKQHGFAPALEDGLTKLKKDWDIFLN
jgi:dTDP-4-dehydrorhamnose reductase